MRAQSRPSRPCAPMIYHIWNAFQVILDIFQQSSLSSISKNLRMFFEHFWQFFKKCSEWPETHFSDVSSWARMDALSLPSDNSILENIFQHFLTIFWKMFRMTWNTFWWSWFMGAHGRASLAQWQLYLRKYFSTIFDNFLKNVQNDLKHILVKSVHGRAWTRFPCPVTTLS